MEIIGLEEIDSTNSYAKSGIDRFADRTVIYAKKQTSGRGRLSRRWIDLGENNLFMTIVLKPSGIFNEVYSNITQYLSVCLCRVLEVYGLEAQIKWPNDVLINNKKIAGILSETVMHCSDLKGLVVGIGVNLNANQADIDTVPDRIATALNLETGCEINLTDFMSKLLEEFFKNYDEFLKEGFEYIKQDYLDRNCFLNKELNIQVFNRIENGLAKDVDSNGGLVLLKGDSKETVLTIGDIL